MNTISQKALSVLQKNFTLSSDASDYDALLLRSAPLHDFSLPKELKAVARAGVGVNNIPVDLCTKRGVVVFNTPGANANSVKELVLAALLLSSRRIFESIIWTQSLAGLGDEINKEVEKKKSAFKGPEIAGKTLGVVGLGAVGILVAHACYNLNMKVMTYDPYGPSEIPTGIERKNDLKNMVSSCDYLSLHIPLTTETAGLFDRSLFSVMKKGLRLINFSRADLIQDEDILWGFNQKILSSYITDFPRDRLLRQEGVIAIPHLGASTPEAEENSSLMASQSLEEFLLKGNILRSVNFPDCHLPRQGKYRIIVANENIVNMVSQICLHLAKHSLNIADMLNRNKRDIAYNIIDVDSPIPESVIKKLRKTEGIIFARSISS